MTSLERVLAALSGGASDRRALSLTLSLYGARLAGLPTESYYRDPGLYLAGQRAVVARFSPDILFAPFALGLEGEAYGAGLAWFATAPPNVRRPLASARAALDAGAAGPGSSRGLAYIVESVRLLAADFAQDRPMAAILTAPIDLPALLIGLDAWLETLLFEEALAAELLELSVAHYVGMARDCFAAGAAFAASPVMLANPRLLQEDLVRKLTLPALTRAFAEAGGPVVFHHGATRIGDSLGLYRDLPGVAGFVIDEKDDYQAARERLGPDTLLLGGLSGPLLERMTPQATRALARRALSLRAGDPRSILASTAADIPWDTPPETIDAIIEAVAEAGPVAGKVEAGHAGPHA